MMARGRDRVSLRRQFEHSEQVEAWLGRSITDDELVEVHSLDELTKAQRKVVRSLARHRLNCLLYLRAVIPDITMHDAMPWLDRFEYPVELYRESHTAETWCWGSELVTWAYLVSPQPGEDAQDCFRRCVAFASHKVRRVAAVASFSRRAVVTLDLPVKLDDDEDAWLCRGARLVFDVGERVQLRFTIDVDIYAPTSRGVRPENSALAALNGPRLATLLKVTEGALGACLEHIDAGDYAGQVNATGFIS
jgi:hypothetical protein